MIVEKEVTVVVVHRCRYNKVIQSNPIQIARKYLPEFSEFLHFRLPFPFGTMRKDSVPFVISLFSNFSYEGREPPGIVND